MKIALFCHSLLSDWNHGNAHFLRGLVTELVARGHRVRSYEASDAWSACGLTNELGSLPVAELALHYPLVSPVRYAPSSPDIDAMLDGVDLAIVHEWTTPELVAELGKRRRAPGARFRLLFHDTHHRKVTDASKMAELDLGAYDGVLAFGEALRERYAAEGWGRRAFTFHEAADTRVFRPLESGAPRRGLVWIGNYGDDERSAELDEFVFRPAARLGVGGGVYGVRYSQPGLSAVAAAGLEYRGFLANYRVPEVFARHLFTVHVPRRPYVEDLPGIPTIRVFEALACGIPLLSSPWSDEEGLFGAEDFIMVENGDRMRAAMRRLMLDAELRRELTRRGLETIWSRHTCAHRVDQLLHIAEELDVRTTPRQPASVATGADSCR